MKVLLFDVSPTKIKFYFVEKSTRLYRQILEPMKPTITENVVASTKVSTFCRCDTPKTLI